MMQGNVAGYILLRKPQALRRWPHNWNCWRVNWYIGSVAIGKQGPAELPRLNKFQQAEAPSTGAPKRLTTIAPEFNFPAERINQPAAFL
jgi:hypothetical protein